MEILALEASTTSVKAMLYHTQTDAFDVLTEEYDCNNTTIMQAEQMYQQMLAVGRKVVYGRKIDMITLSGTWHSLLLCDHKMIPQTRVYMWNYTGASELCRELRKDTEFVNWFYQRTGCMVNAIYPLFKLEMLRRQGWKIEDFLPVSQGAYNTYRMTGQRVSTRCLTSGSGLLNIHTQEYDPDILSKFHISADQLSRIVEYNETFPLCEEAAQFLGVESGIPVLPTNSDGGLNQIGVGALRKGVATFSVGTSGAIRVTADKPVLPEHPGTWCYLSPKAWLSGAATNGGCNCADWAKKRFFPAGTDYGEIESGVTDRNTPPVFLPFLFGERCPGWNDDRRGGFTHILPDHNASDLYYAVQEGVLFNLYQCYQLLSQVNGEPIELRLSGGILNSKRWRQMSADIFNRTMTVDNVVHGSMLGGVVLAMERLGIISDVRDYCLPTSGVIEPNPEKVEAYQRKYERYLKCYQQVD